MQDSSIRNKWPYRILAIGLGFFLLFFVEAILVLFDVAPDTQYVPEQLVQIVEDGQIKGEIIVSGSPFFLEQEDGWMETNPIYHQGKGEGFPHSGSMRKLRFQKEPSKDRYFLLGGSAALGQQPVNLKIAQTWKTVPLGNSVYALPESLSISGALSKKLYQKDIDVEIINAGMIAQDSGGVRRLAKEIIPYKPKGILLYMGNNEGIGMAYGVNGITLKHVPDMQVNLRRFRIYRVLRTTFSPEILAPAQTLEGTKPEVLGHLTQNEWRQTGKALVSGKESTDSVHKALMERWLTNLSAVQDLCNEHGIELYIIATPPHLLYPPFFSSNSPEIGETGIRDYSAWLKHAKDIEQTGNWQEMYSASRNALSIEENHAQGWFVHGTALRHLQKRPNAFEAYEHALLLDLSRKRTRPEYAQAALEFCSSRSCKSVSAHEKMRADVLEQDFILYDQRFGDHEHLTPQGCEWIAGLFAELIQQ